MLILGLDTSTERLSLALRQEGLTLAAREGTPAQRPGEALIGEIDLLLRGAGKRPGDLNGIAVGLGPGSFTGLRVGLAAAQGLAQSLGIPLAGVSSFEAVAAACPGSAALVVADARQGLWYAGLFARHDGRWMSLRPESLLPVAEALAGLPAGDCVLTGPGAAEFALLAPDRAPRLAPAAERLPQAALVAELAEASLRAGGTPPAELAPHYLRRTQAEEHRDRQEGNPPR